MERNWVCKIKNLALTALSYCELVKREREIKLVVKYRHVCPPRAQNVREQRSLFFKVM